jgi:trehalose 6-phosphate phosphatase
MKRVSAAHSLGEFFSRLNEAEESALLLDYDGTLAPFNVIRDDAVPYPGVRKRLNQILASNDTRTVIISGRPIAALLPLLNLGRAPEVWGSHGLERLRSDGSYTAEPLSENNLKGLREVQSWLQRERLTTYCEHKLAGIAVHTRGLDRSLAEEIRERVVRGLAPVANDRGFVLQQFDGGVELRVKGIDKGVAVRTVIDELSTGGIAAYLGDDLTDEDAFRAIKGRGLGFLVREEFRPTIADCWLKPPKELMEFLDVWLQVIGGETCQGKGNGG